MNNEHESRRSGRVVAVAAALSLLCAAIYVLHPARRSEWREINALFYGALGREKPSLDGHLPLLHLQSGEFTPWTHMIARTALQRWALRPEFPGPFEQLMRSWQQGLWKPASPDEWETALRDFDARWERSVVEADGGGRRAWRKTPAQLHEEGWTFSLRGTGVDSRPGEFSAEGALVFDCPPDPAKEVVIEARPPETPAGLPTARLGVTLTLELDIPDVAPGGSTSPPVVRAHWLPNARNLTSLSEFRKVGLCRPAASGEHSLQYRFSFWEEPAWRVQGARLKHIEFRTFWPGKPLRLLSLSGAFERIPPGGASLPGSTPGAGT